MIILDAEQGSKVEQVMNGLENEAYVVDWGPGPVLDLHPSSAVIYATHMESLYLSAWEDEK